MSDELISLENSLVNTQTSLSNTQNTLDNDHFTKTEVSDLVQTLQSDVEFQIDSLETDLDTNYYTIAEVDALVGDEVGTIETVNTNTIQVINSDRITLFDPIVYDVLPLVPTDTPVTLDFDGGNYFRVAVSDLIGSTLDVDAINLKQGQTGVVSFINHSTSDEQPLSFSSNLRFSLGTRPLSIPQKSGGQSGRALFSYTCPEESLALCTGLSGFD